MNNTEGRFQSRFELKITSSRAGYCNPTQHIFLNASRLSAAKAEAKAMLDELGANGFMVYVTDFGDFPMTPMRASKDSVSRWTAWQDQRGMRGIYRGMKWVPAREKKAQSLAA